jgi:5-formyltetrahydrofolate cyclo-ligase
MDPKAAKTELRDAIKDRLSRITEGERAADGRSLSRRIIEALPPEPVPIAAYMPMRTEPDITLLLEHLLEKGYPLYLPRFEGGKMALRQATNLKTLIKGQLGVLEPSPTAPLLKPQDLAIAVVPARAYNKKGQRLGRGNGGYDIWIRAQRAANPNTQFWGVIFEQQLVRDIPMEAHDEVVDAVITAREKIDCKGK